MPAKQTLIHSSKTNRNTKPSARNKSLLFMVPKRTDDVEIIGFLLMNLALLAILAFLYCPKAAALCLAAMDEAEERAARTAESSSAGLPELLRSSTPSTVPPSDRLIAIVGGVPVTAEESGLFHAR